MKIGRNDLLFVAALIFAIWFCATGIIWAYGLAVFFAYPFGILSFVIWTIIKKDNKKRNKLIPALLIFGAGLSLSAFLWMIIGNN